MKKIELLSPAGNYECLKAVVNCGADAVYLGGKEFSARSSAENFADGHMHEVIDFCHLRGVRVYITVNTIIKNSELTAVFKFMEGVYEKGADAFIMQDIGLAIAAKKIFPDIPLHASTQMTAHSVSDVVSLQKAGFKRIVLSRELSIDEIAKIKGNTGAELEVFAHGALCYSYSGQCYMSSYLGGRSGNRGRCAQPCRLPYILEKSGETITEGYLLSPKDIMTVGILDKLIKTGVTGLKIEGRMKSPEYVAAVTRAYRAKLDELLFAANPADSAVYTAASRIFNRGGSHTTGMLETYSNRELMSVDSSKPSGVKIGEVVGYDAKTGICRFKTGTELVPGDGIEIFTEATPHVGCGIEKKAERGDIASVKVEGKINKGDAVYKSYDKKLNDELKRLGNEDKRFLCVNAEAMVKIGEKPSLRLSLDALGKSVSVSFELGESVAKAENAPVSAERISEQLQKTGGTGFVLDNFKLEASDGAFIGMSALNELRRNAISQLTAEYIQSFRREPKDASYSVRKPERCFFQKELTVYAMSAEQLEAAIHAAENGVKLNRVYADCGFIPENIIINNIGRCHQTGVRLFAAVPFISNGINLDMLEESEIDGYLAGNFGTLYELRETRKEIVADYTFHCANELTQETLRKFAKTVALSPELSFKEIDEIARPFNEITIYGKALFMTTRHCPVGIYAAKKDGGRFCRYKNNAEGYRLVDRTNACQTVMTNCKSCVAYIFNDRPVYLLNKPAEIRNMNPVFLRLQFTDESGEETGKILRRAERFLKGEAVEPKPSETFTYGHFFKGIQ